MCAALGTGDNDFWVSESTGEVAEVHLERRSRLSGYCIVVWRHGHVAEPSDLDLPDSGGDDRGQAAHATEACIKPGTGQLRKALARYWPVEKSWPSVDLQAT